MEHSRLLKFLVTTAQSPNMTEESPKIKFEYQNPTNVEAEVPGSQNLREVDANSDDFGDQNIDGTEIQNGGSYRIIHELTETQTGVVHGSEVTMTTVRLSSGDGQDEEMKEVTTIEERKPKTKIPKLKFRQTVEKVKAEQIKAKESEDNESLKSKINRRSKVTTLSSKPIVTKRNSALMDDEFEKIYEDLIDEHFNFDDKLLGNIEDPEKLEMKFEEMIHDYEENKVQPINIDEVRQSRIPFRRRRSEQVDIDKAISEKEANKKAKTGSSIPLLRSKSEHDRETVKVTKKLKEEDTCKEKTKHSSSIPLPRRKSGQDGDLSKTTYKKTERDGVVTETVTTTTKTTPVEQVVLEKGSMSTTTYETNDTDKQSKEESQDNEDKNTIKASVERIKTKKSIPRLIDAKYDNRKVIRTYTRTVTTEKVVSGKDKKLDDANIAENFDKYVELEPATGNTSTVEPNFKQKENIKTSTVYSLQEENILKDSVRVAIPSYDSEIETNDGDVQTVEVTKLLEWNTNIDKKVRNPKFKSQLETNESTIIKYDDRVEVSLNNKTNKVESFDKQIEVEHTKPVQRVIKDPTKTEENKSIKSAETIKKVSEVNTAIISTDTQPISYENEIVNMDINIKVKEREGSRFNKVSNLTILKGIDHEENLKSPRLLTSNNPETESNFKPSSPVDLNIKTSQNAKETKIIEVLKTPKLDKDGNPDVLPEYNIRIKRYSKEMKEIDDSLKQWERDNKADEEDLSKSVEIDRLTDTKLLKSKVDISNMDSTRNLLSRVLDREKKIETIKTKAEPIEINNNEEQGKESDSKVISSDTDKTIKTFKTSDISYSETNLKNQRTVRTTENVSQEFHGHIKTENNIETKESLLQNNQESIEELGIKGKVGKLINRIDGKKFSNNTTKKEEETPVRRSVLSKVAMFERQEPLDSIKSRKPRPESKMPKLVIKEEQVISQVHVHTPTIVEEVLKSADWDLDLNKDEDNNEVPWKIDFDKIILDRKDTNMKMYVKSNNDSMYQEQRFESVTKVDDNLDNINNESLPKVSNSISNQKKVEVASNISTLKETIVKEEDYSSVNLVHDNTSNVEIVQMRNKLKVESPIKNKSTSLNRLSFDAKDFEDKIKNQVLTDAPVIIVQPKINNNMSKSTEAIFSTQPKINSKNIEKKIDRTTSMTEKLYPEKVKANIALYESIKNDTYYKSNKNDSKVIENPSSASIFETYKNERYDKANKLEIRTTYTPQNSFNSDYASINELPTRGNTYEYESSISVDETKNNNKENNLTYGQKYGSLQFINESIDIDSIDNEPLKSEVITEMNKAVYRLTFDDSKSNEFGNEVTDNLQPLEVSNTNKSKEFITKDTKQKFDIDRYEEIGIKPINEIIHESYEVYSKSSNAGEIVTNRKFRRFKSKYDDEDDETGERMMKSLPNVESGDVKGKLRLLTRVRSVDKYEDRKELINIKEMPRKLSVLEKIALFEVIKVFIYHLHTIVQ
ncbi:hypothetical protein K1T71_014391 [Dendrolimus kikuchii]|uniref:Uncharacterized protein n=1 Tax=Dendrolimus kikuchii TaxID=765133 RepID=A0ACC1CDV9_9NEOP|nr:hypothetical protein K1T71_014391 [Dendrolimus kikuchii]